MYAKTFGITLCGIKPILVEIEVALSRGLPSFQIVGLPDQSVNESKERISLALNSIKAKKPNSLPYRTSVNLAPAEIKKEGPQLDLPIALAYLQASGQIKNLPKDFFFLGELGFDGSLKKVKGVLPMLLLGKELNFKKVIVPKENEREAGLVEGLEIYALENLKKVVDFLEGKILIEPVAKSENFVDKEEDVPLLLDPILERVVLISASGRHNLLLAGPPGTGKSLIAQEIKSILPNLSYEESLEISKIYSALGILDELLLRPPFRNPHHSASSVSILGGGKDAKPGEVTLAHLGILFFDELPEFRRDVLEGIREPLETGQITVSRAKERITYPAKFLFLASMNPCPCGFYGDQEKECVCRVSEIQKYRKKISGPILDRIDLLFWLPRMKSEKMFSLSEKKLSSLRDKVIEISERMERRFQEEKFKFNSEIPHHKIKKYIKLDYESETFLRRAIDNYQLSLRSVHKILRVALTIADIENKDKIETSHLAEALQYKLSENIFGEG